MAENSSGRRFLYVARRVLFSPVSAVLWIAAVAVSATFSWSPIPIVVAAALQLVLLNRRLNDEDYLRKVLSDQDAGEQSISDKEFEDEVEGMDFETRQRLRYIRHLQQDIDNEARGEDVQPYARAELERIAQRLPGLVRQAMRIASRRQQLVRYLQNIDERALSAYAENLRRRIEETSDPVARKQYEQALRAREAELATYRSIAQATERIDSQLENIEATFASWKARIIRLKTVDIGDVASFSQGLVNELDTLGHDIELLDTSVQEALAPEATVSAGISSGGRP